ncbi:hypothetical protein GCM10010915_03550 [Microbacterium faecale]|uniref:Uncharacterized protein n=1 Tax=Microbacterium faecale TaxID=1804630 RepID=A0A917DCU8_9MICO|nr:hypothetical protein GCM10010915_03550 [Microbacterium faecale]
MCPRRGWVDARLDLDERSELERLRREVQELRMDNEFLGKNGRLLRIEEEAASSAGPSCVWEAIWRRYRGERTASRGFAAAQRKNGLPNARALTRAIPFCWRERQSPVSDGGVRAIRAGAAAR